MNFNPNTLAANRTARLVAEATTPAYTSETGVTNGVLVRAIEQVACTEEFCHVDGRATDHRGEHSDDQLLDWYARPGMLQSLVNGKGN